MTPGFASDAGAAARDASAAPGSGSANGTEARIAESGAKAIPTSVLLVTLDTTRADRIGCYGAKDAATPTLDALAAGGVRFERVTSPSPLTVPSHATMLSGLVPRRHGARDNAARLSPGLPLLTERLAAAGRATAAVVSSVVLDRAAGLDRGFTRYDDDLRHGPRSAFDYRERAAGHTVDAAIARLESFDGPFFLWVHLFDPHAPYVPPGPFHERFAGRPYEGEIAYVDRELARLVAAVRRTGAPVLTVVAGDHGESLGEHGEATHGLFVYEATQRVPWILHGTGVPEGRVVSTRVGLVDLAPTVLDLLGLPPLPESDGRSVAPALRAGREPEPSTYEVGSRFPSSAFGWASPRGIVAGERKAIDLPRRELYDLSEDPRERRNLAPTHADAVDTLLDALPEEPDVIDPAPADEDASADRRRDLAALGYASGGGGRARDGDPLDPKDGVGLLRRLDEARAQAQSGAPDRAETILRGILAVDGSNVQALWTLVSARSMQGDHAGAIAAARRAAELRPDDDLTRFHLANALAGVASDRESARKAREAYERALERNPRHADTWLNFAAFVSRTGPPDDVLAIVARADAAGVSGPDLEVTRGVAALRLGRVDDAERAFGEALRRNPEDPQTLEAMARLRARRGDPGAAVAHYRHLLTVAPRWDVAVALGDLLAGTLGDRDGADRAYREALALGPPAAALAEIRERLARVATGD